MFFRVLLRFAAMLYAFLMGMVIATGYGDMVDFVLIGVALAVAFATVEVASMK